MVVGCCLQRMHTHTHIHICQRRRTALKIEVEVEKKRKNKKKHRLKLESRNHARDILFSLQKRNKKNSKRFLHFIDSEMAMNGRIRDERKTHQPVRLNNVFTMRLWSATDSYSHSSLFQLFFFFLLLFVLFSPFVYFIAICVIALYEQRNLEIKGMVRTPDISNTQNHHAHVFFVHFNFYCTNRWTK